MTEKELDLRIAHWQQWLEYAEKLKRRAEVELRKLQQEKATSTLE